MGDLPRLRPRQWTLLERFASIDKRLEQDAGAEPIAVGIFDQGTLIVRPGVADPHIDETDMHALSNAGLLDIVSSTSSLVRFRVSQRAFDLLDERARQDGQPSPAELVRRYRERRHWLAGRISLIARWVVLVAGTALVIWSALTGSWAFTVIGAIGAIVGLPVTVVAQHVQRWLTDRVDEFLAGIFEPKR